jgi:hypothetical protein
MECSSNPNLKCIAQLAFAALLTAAPFEARAAEPNDAPATELADDAMQGDYLAMRFKPAEKKLKKAIARCRQGCSAAVRARLHRDLAVVYIAGTKQSSAGEREMKRALEADPALELDADFATPEVERAFLAAGGRSAALAEASDSSKAAPALEEAVEAPAEPEAAPASDTLRRNWFSLSLQQDMLFYGETRNVCSGAAQYQCFLEGQSYDGPIYEESGNQLSGGLGFATRRVLLGYDRVFGERLTLGARLGVAFGGSPKATNGSGTAFLPVHAELRGNYAFSSFADRGVRPYLGLAIGVGEIDGHVPVEFYENEAGYAAGAKGTLDAWRKTGNTLLGAHAGLALSLADEHALLFELRLLQMLGASALAAAGSIGYAFGL